MPRLREEYDADLIKTSEPSDYKTDRNRYELFCSVCGSPLFVNEATFRGVNRSMTHDLENPLVCGDCERDYDDAAFD